MPDLLQILPPLSQSRYETAACPRSYVATYIDRNGSAASIPSERGQDIHSVMAQYIEHCASRKVPADWQKFDSLAATSGPVAGPILDGLRDHYVVDWEHVYGCEMTLGLDDAMHPARMVPAGEARYSGMLPELFNVTYSSEPIAHIGTLDTLFLSDDGQHVTIEDFKSSPAIFEAETYQAKLYAFMVMKHWRSVQKVTFKLNFVRYKGCTRSADFTRMDLPALQQEFARARERQRITHERPDSAMALPSNVCVYCPLAKNFTCPIAEWNEYTLLQPAERLKWKMWMTQMGKINSPILKAYAEMRGPVRYEDGNGNVYEYGEQEVASTSYPLDAAAITILREWKSATGEDLLDGKLNISSTKLKGLLKAKKREALRQKFEDSVAMTTTKPKFAIRTPEGVEEEFNPYAED